MGLTCFWRRRRIARLMLTSRPIEDDPGLKRHVEQCSGCSRALRDYECFDTVLQRGEPPALSPDFNSKLAARLAAVASEPPSLPETGRAGRRTTGFSRHAAALACLGGLILWAGASATRPGANQDRVVWIKPLRPNSDRPPLNRDIADRQTGAVIQGSLTNLLPSFSQQPIVRRAPHHRRSLLAHAPKSYRRHRRVLPQAPADLQNAGAAVGARELFISLTASPWRETGDAYAQIGDEPSARDAYAGEFERNGNPEAALRAAGYSGASGDPAAELQYCALALSANP